MLFTRLNVTPRASACADVPADARINPVSGCSGSRPPAATPTSCAGANGILTYFALDAARLLRA
eukprot:2537-Eustigmatos_ZCMA.PRE.1